MTSELLDVTCSSCGTPLTADDLGLAPGEPFPFWFSEITEMECPHCGGTLLLDADGRVLTEEEEAEHELFTVDAEGELSAERLLSVTCPHCGCVHEASEPDVTRCPRCRHVLPIDDGGHINDGRDFQRSCPGCGSLMTSSGGEDERCWCCGWYDSTSEQFGPDEEEEAGLEEAPQENVPSRTGFRAGKDNPQPRVLVVAADGGGDYRRIQDAVWAAWSCSIHVRPGRYEEALVLSRPVEIVAEGPPGSVLVDGGTQAAVRIECGEVTLRGLSLTAEDVAVEVLRCQPLLTECSLHASGRAAVLVSGIGAQPLLSHCQVEGRQVGVQVEGRGLARLKECVVGAGAVSVELIEGGRLDARSCRFQGEGTCQVCVRALSEAALAHCDLQGSAAGVWVSGGAARLRGCRVHDCRGTGVVAQAGIAALEECRLDHNGGVGLAVRVQGKAVLRRCRLEDNQDNVLLSGRSIALIDDCVLGSPADTSLRVRGYARVHLRRCRLEGGGRRSLHIGLGAEVRLEGCMLGEETKGRCEAKQDIRPGCW